MAVFNRDVSLAPPAKSANDRKSPWEVIDRDTLPKGLQSLYDTWHQLDQDAKAAKNAFTSAMRECMDTPAGKTAYFSDRFGKLSFAFLDEQTAKAANSAVDFRKLMKRG